MILVTGATGLVGSRLVQQLAQQQLPVRALYRSEDKKNKVLQLPLFKGVALSTVTWVKADVTKITTLEPVFEGVKQVYHCAGYVSFDPYQYRKLKKINIKGTANIVNLSIDFGVEKFCHVSSVAALGDKTFDGFITEESYFGIEQDNHVYAITKYGAEMEVWRGSQEGLKIVIVNPGVILGDHLGSESSQIFTKVKKGLKYYTTGGSGFVGVNDVIKAMKLLMDSTVYNQRYVLVSENVSYQTLLAIIANHYGVKVPSVSVAKSVMKMLMIFDGFVGVFVKKRSLTKYTLKSLYSKTMYSSEKFKNEFSFSFEPIEEVISKIDD